jgi:hypothetical protein
MRKPAAEEWRSKAGLLLLVLLSPLWSRRADGQATGEATQRAEFPRPSDAFHRRAKFRVEAILLNALVPPEGVVASPFRMNDGERSRRLESVEEELRPTNPWWVTACRRAKDGLRGQRFGAKLLAIHIWRSHES